MPTHELVVDAAQFTAAGLALALIAMWAKPDLRRNTVAMAILMALGLVGLWSLLEFGGGLRDATLVHALREGLLAILAIGFASITVMFVLQVLLAAFAIPRILADVLIAAVLIVYGLYRMNAVGVNLASIITTSAILTGGIALSLREPLENLWGGIALQLDNTCRIGDWIRMEGVMGQVVGIRWRCTSIATNNGETVIIPNNQLMKNRVTVLARRGDARIHWRREIEFGVAYDVPPARVIDVVEAALARAEIRNVAKEPHPSVICAGFGESSMNYVARYRLTDLLHDLWTDSEVRLHIRATLARNRMEIPFPRRVMIPGRHADAKEALEHEIAARCETLGRLELFAALTDDERRALASELADLPFVADDIIARQGEAADSLYILARGHVGVYNENGNDAGARDRLAALSAPAYFGEMGLLTGQARAATVIAEGEVLCYRLDKAAFDAILRARPELVEAMSRVVVARQAANDATLEAISADVRARRASTLTAELVRRIKGFFGISR
jgi:small-conductance mechanosensitive channel